MNEEELFEPAPVTKSRGGLTVAIIAIVTIAGLIGAAGWYGYQSLSELVSRFQVEDYSGEGVGETTIVIEPGDTGSEVARKLVDADVVASFDAIYRPMLRTNFTIFPGTYSFPMQISGQRALEILIEGKNRVVISVTLPEGFTNAQMVSRLAEALGLDSEALNAAIENLEVPVEAPNREGYLFPATYQFDPGASADMVIATIHERMLAELRSFGVAPDQYHEVLTKASLIQLEAKLAIDFFKVSRVIDNRLAINMPLQFDSTVNYGTGGTKVTTTDEQRADRNPYNTYVFPGLPIGPIGNPGSLAIESALSPVDGPWLYFVTVNLQSGETVFSNTFAEHLVAVEEFRRWIRANPSWNQ
jgi:UPF0755 protein